MLSLSLQVFVLMNLLQGPVSLCQFHYNKQHYYTEQNFHSAVEH